MVREKDNSQERDIDDNSKRNNVRICERERERESNIDDITKTKRKPKSKTLGRRKKQEKKKGRKNVKQNTKKREVGRGVNRIFVRPKRKENHTKKQKRCENGGGKVGEMV